MEFYVGQRVEAKPAGKSKWYGGTVMAVNDCGESFRVCYDGGMWNSWLPVNDPAVSRRDIRCHLGDGGSAPSSAASSMDHSPIRRALEDPGDGKATRGGNRKLGKKGKSMSEAPAAVGATPVGERLTRAQAAAAAEAEAKAEAAAFDAAVAAANAQAGAAQGRSGDSDSGSDAGNNGPTTPGRKRNSLATFRETKAMKAQREAAMKRREELEQTELAK
jgi:hypothetical protein